MCFFAINVSPFYPIFVRIRLKYVPWVHADNDGTNAAGHVAAANASATDAGLSDGSWNDATTASHAWTPGKLQNKILSISCCMPAASSRLTRCGLQGMMMGPYSPAMPFSPSYSPEYGYDQHVQQQHGGDFPGPYFQGDHRYEANAGFREDFHHPRDERRGRDHHGRFKTAEEMTDEGIRINTHAYIPATCSHICVAIIAAGVFRGQNVSLIRLRSCMQKTPN